MATASLLLVPFASRPHTDGVRQMLHQLGYQVRTLANDTWLEATAEDIANPTILVFARKDVPCKAIVRRLDRSRAPSLAVFDCQETERLSAILDCCDEFSCWPCHEEELALRLERLLRESNSSSSIGTDGIAEEFIELDMVGRSPRFLEALASIKKIAGCDAPVLIDGATGTGKEMAARAIHYLGDRRNFPFVPINCGAIPDTLVENELFGHERGAFTDARDAQPGVVTQAEGGTLFLDEVDTLSSKAQVSILRFLQDHEFKPLGGKRTRKANVRIIAASNTNMEELVAQGAFRQDLWFRLNLLTLTLPSLSERPGDVLLLAEYFLDRYNQQYGRSVRRFYPHAIEWMSTYDWPGNVRELENLVHRAVLISDGPVAELSQPGFVPARDEVGSVDRPITTDTKFNEAKSRFIADFERQYLDQLMNEARGNVTLAAKRAGKERRALGKLLKKHGIARNPYAHRA